MRERPKQRPKGTRLKSRQLAFLAFVPSMPRKLRLEFPGAACHATNRALKIGPWGLWLVQIGRLIHSSLPPWTCAGVRKVFTSTPLPQTVIVGNRLNQSPVGTSGLVSSQPANDLSASASMLRSAIRWSRCCEKRPRYVFALDLGHQEPA